MKKIVTFTASWCGPCKMLKPVLNELHNEGLIVWENYDIDEERAYASQMGVKSVPRLFFYNEQGELFRDETGYMPRERVLQIYGVDAPEAAPVVEEAPVVEPVPVVEETPVVEAAPVIQEEQQQEVVIVEQQQQI